MGYTRGTEIKNNELKDYNVSFGTIDKTNPKSLYIKISAWGNPISNDNNYGLIVRRLNKKVKSEIHLNINKTLFNHNKTMVNLDMRESGIKKGKSSFMSCEITLFQLDEYDLKDEILKNGIDEIINIAINKVLKPNESFKFYKKKIIANEKLKA